MALFPDSKGITASLLTSMRLLITAAVVGVTSSLYSATLYPIAAAVFLVILTILITIFFYERGKSLINLNASRVN
jgi:hypothetical protein